jgi:DNA segregation ATPase FtsK/SpoIIIE-like protein
MVHACARRDSISRRRIGAARIVETMEKRGLVGPSNGAKDREVLIDAM